MAERAPGECCYLRLSEEQGPDGVVETFASQPCVSSAWGPMQHGGPVAALLTRAMDRCHPRQDSRLTRVTVEILGAVPLTDVRVSAAVVRPGRRVELLSARLESRDEAGGWRFAAIASAWRLGTRDTEQLVTAADPALGRPDGLGSVPSPVSLTDLWPPSGFIQVVDGHIATLGGPSRQPSQAWLRLSVPLIEGEPTTPLEQAMALADVANGIGARLDPTRVTFLNTELTVHLFCPPAGPWFGMVAESSIGPDGVGMSAAVLHDEGGPIGRVAQNLLVEPK